MAAHSTVNQLSEYHNVPPSSYGVLTLFGYGIRVSVDRGHLIVEDGIGTNRSRYKLPRVGHGLKRLVVVGSDGIVSLSALRWLADQDASFVMLERDGSVLATTGPVRPSDARMRRAQGLAHSSGVALSITRELITHKLAGQEHVAREILLNEGAADTIARFNADLALADSIERIRFIESQAAAAYWFLWRALPVNFPKNDLGRVPNHWCSFGARVSPLTGSPRSAVNPVNAILNYLYAVLESESRLAVAELGLDPGLGVMHADKANRDSLACDLMEPIRPKVDAYVLDWITRQPLRKEWFFERADGNARLMGPFTVHLSQTAPTWRRAVAPFAEWLARTISSPIHQPDRNIGPSTRLTQNHKRDARPNISHNKSSKPGPRPQSLCLRCGSPVEAGLKHCGLCAVMVSKENIVEVARVGRLAAQRPQAQASRAATQRRQRGGARGWLASSHPAWLTTEVYEERIRPQLARIPYATIASRLGVSEPYAADIRAGRRRPHPRHWVKLACLAEVSS